MPELPDITIYIEALEARILGKRLERIRLASPFLLRTVTPPLDSAQGRVVQTISRIGKRIVIGFDGGCYLVLHLMIAGRLRWLPPNGAIPRKLGLAAFDFDGGSLLLTEAGSKRRASLHLIEGSDALKDLDPGGVDPLTAGLDEFSVRLTLENHTLKRSLTDPRLFSGIGNAYSDEILHRARLSPVKLTQKLTAEEIERLRDATRTTLIEWTERLREETGERFPEKVTAFRKEMAVHGKFRQPCPVCAAPVQRIVYASNETNYCARCQTGGKLLADRALSRLLGSDWPKSIDEM